jgi:DNA-binding transcriptional LysR family regulator
MARNDVSDLMTFIAVARERSFTRASAQLGVSPSALSHSLKSLEERLGVRLLTRTTRSVAPTAAGEQLLGNIAPQFDAINAQLRALTDWRDKPSGLIRITADEFAVSDILWPALRRFLPRYPEISVELVTDYRLVDIVADRFDAGVRPGEIVAKDMIGVRIGPDMRMAVVAAPPYLAKCTRPKRPQDLADHQCINLRLPIHGRLHAWEFAKRGRDFRVKVEGSLIFNSITPMLKATLEGFGIAYLPQRQVQPLLDDGKLIHLLAEWTPPFAGYYLYYPRHRQKTAAFALLLVALRYRTL